MSTNSRILETPWERLRQERERLGMSQSEFGALGGVQKWAQIKYEKGARKPDSKYLEGIAAGGADVAYILTGQPAALRAELADVRMATEAAKMIGGTQEEKLEYQASIHNALRVARAKTEDELSLLIDYRLCVEPDQQQIRALAARLRMHPPPVEATPVDRKGGAKK